MVWFGIFEIWIFLTQCLSKYSNYILVVKRLYSVPGRPTISNSGCYTEKIYLHSEIPTYSLAHKESFYTKDTNHFFWKLRDFKDIPKGALLCTIDFVGMYPNINVTHLKHLMTGWTSLFLLKCYFNFLSWYLTTIFFGLMKKRYQLMQAI